MSKIKRLRVSRSFLSKREHVKMRLDFFPIYRQATQKDAIGLAKVHILAWKKAFLGMVPASYLDRLTLSQKTEEWIKIIKNNKSKTILSQDTKNEIIGFVNFGKYRDIDLIDPVPAEIRGLYVHPEFWRKGIGRNLMDLAIEECKNNGYKTIALWSLDANERAQKFYQSLGFYTDGKIKIDEKILGFELKEYRFVKTL